MSENDLPTGKAIHVSVRDKTDKRYITFDNGEIWIHDEYYKWTPLYSPPEYAEDPNILAMVKLIGVQKTDLEQLQNAYAAVVELIKRKREDGFCIECGNKSGICYVSDDHNGVFTKQCQTCELCKQLGIDD